MKQFILISAFFLSLVQVSFGSNNPEKVTIIESQEVTVSIDKVSNDLFTMSSVSEDGANFNFITKEEVQFVQIFNSTGMIEFQLPVDSKKIRINKNLFSTGKYTLGFKIDGQDALYKADVLMK